MKHTARYKTWEAFRIFVLAVISLIVVFPFFWMIICSFKSSSEVLSKNSFWPSVWHVENYALAWGRARFDIYFRNSTLMALASVAGQLITSSMAAYAFAKLKFKLSKPLFMVFLCSMMIPLEATIVSNYLTLSAMELMDTFFAVISTSIVSVFGVFLLRQFYMTIPDALLEAARIDGASEIRTFTQMAPARCSPSCASSCRWAKAPWPPLRSSALSAAGIATCGRLSLPTAWSCALCRRACAP